ncbi:MAG TPA: glutamate 5-kinase [Rhizomicrobium sp.]
MYATAKRIVIKVGSALLVESDSGELRRDWLNSLCEDAAGLRRKGKEVLFVSSGAIALGRRSLALRAGALRLEESQAAAAAGQVRLAQAYADCFSRQNIVAAQVLLTSDDTEDRKRYLNARATLKTLLALGSVAVINENDTVATAEIRFGDNDRLAARVASMMEADCLVLLSDVDGLYTADPSRDANAVHIPDVSQITGEMDAMAGASVSGVGSGGMASKLVAARIATAAGCEVIIASGTADHPLRAIAQGARVTQFHANTTPAAARKRWIAGVLKPLGALVVDDGAIAALAKGKSLLPAGVRTVEGHFERGDVVIVRDRHSMEIARGLAAYGADDARRIAGMRSQQIEAVLGYRGRDELIHRDDLLTLQQGAKP